MSVSAASLRLRRPCRVSLPPPPPPVTRQVHGGAGVSDVTPLAHFWASARTLRLADGPGECSGVWGVGGRLLECVPALPLPQPCCCTQLPLTPRCPRPPDVVHLETIAKLELGAGRRARL